MVHKMMANTRNPETHPGFCAIRPIMLYLPKSANLPPRYNTPPVRPHIVLSLWIKGAWKTIGRTPHKYAKENNSLTEAQMCRLNPFGMDSSAVFVFSALFLCLEPLTSNF
jgi:hypothetical protein